MQIRKVFNKKRLSFVFWLWGLCALLLSSCYRSSSNDDQWSVSESSVYSLDFMNQHHYGLNYNFKVCSDSLWLQGDRPMHTDFNGTYFVDSIYLSAGDLIVVADLAIIPEDSSNADQLEQFISRGIRKSKSSSMVIVSESPKCGAMYYADRVKKEYPEFDVRVSILGHLQRGGSPSAYDRILASRLGVGAITALREGQRNVMIGIKNDEVVYVPFCNAIKSDKPVKKELINVLGILSI